VSPPGDAVWIRILLSEIFDLASREGIFRRMRETSPFGFENLCRALERDPGYDLSRGNRRRMVAVLLDLVREAGWDGRDGGPSFRTPEEGSVPPADAQLAFFRECLRNVPAYLRGGPSPFGFDEASAGLWDRFLGCPSFRYCRRQLLKRMGVENQPSFRLLDLCCGTGWGLAEAARICPRARMTAVDFTGSLGRAARDRVIGAVPDVRWIDSGQWKGFGDPLPLPDGEFDAVLFCCGDPYIPGARRGEVYREIARVLAPGGRLGVLTRGYPDPGRRAVPSAGMRLAALIHDFSESVCRGWEGFVDPAENARVFRETGFREEVGLSGGADFLEGALWVLVKGERRG